MKADYPVIIKMNTEDGFPGGLTIAEAVQAAKSFEEAGASMLVPSCGFTARTSFYMMRGNVPIREYVKTEKNPATKMGMVLFGRLIVREFPFQPLFSLRARLDRLKTPLKSRSPASAGSARWKIWTKL